MLTHDLLNPRNKFTFDSDDGSGSGGEGGEGSSKSKKKEIEPVVLPEDVLDSLKGLVSRAGDESEALKILYNDNKNLREKLRSSEDNSLRDGMVAIEKDKAQIVTKVDELGGWDKVLEKVEGYETATTKLNQLEKQTQVREIANAYDYKFEVLNDLIKDRELEIREEKGEKDEKVKKAYLKSEDGKEETELSKFITEEKSVYLPALQQESNSGGGRRITRQDSSNNGASSGGGSGLVDKFRQRNKEKAEAGNPLNPKQK